MWFCLTFFLQIIKKNTIHQQLFNILMKKIKNTFKVYILYSTLKTLKLKHVSIILYFYNWNNMSGPTLAQLSSGLQHCNYQVLK